MLNQTAGRSSSPRGLIRILGVGFGLAVIVGSTIGIGILRTPGLVAGQLPNRAAILAVWIVGGLYTLVGAACLAELGTMLPEAGGYYVYARRAFGDTVGFAVGWSDWVTYCAVLGYVSIAMGEFTALIVPSLAGYEKAVSITALAALAGLQLCGLRVSSRFQEITTVVKFGAFLTVGIAAMLFAPSAAAQTGSVLQSASFAGLIVALQSVVITYGGWQSGLYFSEEDRDPDRNVPRSMIGGVAGVIVVYLLVNLALLSVLPLADLARSTLPAADAAQVLLGGRGREIITILSIVSLPPMLNAILMIGTRILFAMGRDGILWRRAASVTAGGTPAAAMVATTVVALALIATGTFQRLVAVAAFFLAANYVVCCLALVVLRWREPDRPRPYRAWGYPWSAAIVLAGAAAFLVGATIGDPGNAAAALVLVAVGFVVRGGTSAAQRRAATVMLIVVAIVYSADRRSTTAAQTASPFSRFVDTYLDRFAQYHPSIAAGNGIHAHDAQLEDFSSSTIAAEIAWLRHTRRQLDGFDLSTLTPDERVDHRILSGIVDGWLLDLDTVRTWTRNPMIYAAAISDGIHNLMTMESSPAPVRIRQVIAKLRGVPALVAAARTNIKTPPRVFVERAAVMFHGASDLLGRDLRLAFADVSDAALQKELASAADEARQPIDAYTTELETSVLRSATGRYAIGTASVEARYRTEELIDIPAVALLAIGERELKAVQAAFTEAAARVAPGRPALDVWRDVLEDHPKRGEVVAAAQKTVDELFAFIREHRLVDLPPGEGVDRVVVAAAPAYDLGLASMHSSPPLEPTPVKSYYYITDAQAAWPPDRQNLWLQKFNYATLADISAHEVAPGHYVHSVFMRRTPGKIRRIWIGLNPFPQPSSGQDGWAHYAEQMISDEGFKRDDPRYRLAQTSEALTRICRLIAGLRLHSGEWSIDRAAQLFERDAHLPAPAAHQEAVRGTYDPTYGGYFLGKLAAFKLRRDYQQARGASFSLREFHERVMTNGIAPWWAHRQLLLPGDRRAVIE